MAVVLFGGCKEKKEFNEETAQATVDERSAMGEIDEVLKDVNTVIMERYLLRGRSSGSGSSGVCGVSLDTIDELQGSMRISYNGNNCYGRIRTGSVSFTVEGYPLQKWKQQGCRLKINSQDYTSTRSSDGHFVKLIGEQELFNETGNSWFEIWYMGASQAVYRHTFSNLRVEYPGGLSALINGDRRLTFSQQNKITTCRVEGLASQQGKSHVEAWGQGTNNKNFAADVETPYVWKSSCGAVAPISGNVVVALEDRPYDLRCRFGVDASGNQVTDPSKCPFGWEATWSRKKRTNARLFGYY